MNELKWDLSITISAIIAVAAIISPILTAIINNVHQRSMRKLELKNEHYEKTVSYQKEIFENYLSKTGNYIGSCFTSTKSLMEYDDAYFVALLYAPSELQTLMKSANTAIRTGKVPQAISAFEELIPPNTGVHTKVVNAITTNNTYTTYSLKLSGCTFFIMKQHKIATAHTIIS